VAPQVKPLLIVLNGTSSAGKTTLATSLQKRFSTPVQVSGVDTFLALQPDSMFAPPGSGVATDGFTWCPVQVEGQQAWAVRPGLKGEALMRAVHAYWAACAAEGIAQVIDHVLLSEAMALDLQERLADFDPMYVAVRCPLDVVDQRERDRGDRLLGQGRGIGATVHDFLTCDVDVDTSVLRPEEAADAVLAAAQARHRA
jgi:chloramphenicol 3-O phosphotransferase